MAEVLITLVVLGVVAALTIPSVVRKQYEAANRAKIKKAMSAYDTAVQKMVVENGIKNDAALSNWADSNNCANSSAYFKAVEVIDNSNCRFRAADGLYWDITSIENPYIALSKDDFKAHNTLVADSLDTSNLKVFGMVAKFDENGALRINDLEYGQNIIGGTYVENSTKIESFIQNKKIENKYPTVGCSSGYTWNDDETCCANINGKNCISNYCDCYEDDNCWCLHFIYNKDNKAIDKAYGCNKDGENCTYHDLLSYPDKNSRILKRTDNGYCRYDEWDSSINNYKYGIHDGYNCSGPNCTNCETQ